MSEQGGLKIGQAEYQPVDGAYFERRGLRRYAGVWSLWDLDMARHARERQRPPDYLARSYCESWLAGMETQLTERGLVSPDELRSGEAASPAPPEIAARVVRPEQVRAAPIMTTSYARPNAAVYVDLWEDYLEPAG